MRRPLGTAAVALALLLVGACGGNGEKSPAAARTDASTISSASSTSTSTASRASGAGDTTPTLLEDRSGDTSVVRGPTTTVATGGASAVLLLPAGTFEFDTTGFSQTGEGPTARRTEMPPVTSDTVTHEAGPGYQIVTVTTTYDAESRQRIVLHVTATDVTLVQLTFSSTSNGMSSEQRVTPKPPPVTVRAPYRVGDRWESAWSDDSFGVQGVGTGSIERREQVTTTAGVVDTVVVRLDHRLSGTVSGRLQLTTWIDPASGQRVRDETIVDITAAAVASHLESRRTLRR